MLLLLLACTDPPVDPVDTLAACDAGPCRLEHVADAWREDPDRVRPLVVGLPEDQRQALVGELARRFPMEVAPLCQDLPPGSESQLRCSRYSNRPHLEHTGASVEQARTAPETRAASGPAGRFLPVPELDPPLLGDVSPMRLQDNKEACDSDQVCLVEAAAERALDDRLDLAAEHCAASASFDECTFRAAELVVETSGLEHLSAAVTLCQASSHAPRCMEHLIEQTLPLAPPADAATQSHVDAVTTVAAAWSALELPAYVTAVYADLVWSTWVRASVWNAQTLDDRLPALLPDVAQPHMRYAAAQWLGVHRTDDAAFALADSVARLNQALSTPAGDLGTGDPVAPQLQNSKVAWMVDLGVEDSLPATWCGGMVRRAWSDDPAIDGQIAVIEALARAPNVDPTLLLPVIHDDTLDPLVRWTALRLVGDLNAGLLTTVDSSLESDPLLGPRLDPPPKGPQEPRKDGKGKGKGKGKGGKGKGKRGKGPMGPPPQGPGGPDGPAQTDPGAPKR